MTRTEQNGIIIASLGKQLADMPNVQEVIGRSFSNWFHSLVRQVSQQMATAQPQPQQQATQEGVQQ
jgi:hypothetical protein